MKYEIDATGIDVDLLQETLHKIEDGDWEPTEEEKDNLSLLIDDFMGAYMEKHSLGNLKKWGGKD